MRKQGRAILSAITLRMLLGLERVACLAVRLLAFAEWHENHSHVTHACVKMPDALGLLIKMAAGVKETYTYRKFNATSTDP